MLKQVNKFLVAAVLSCILSIPGAAFAVTDTTPIKDISQNSNIELIEQDVHVEDSDIEPIDTGKLKQSVVPDPSKEGKKVVGLFLKTMAAVAFCVVLLYAILLFVKKYYFVNFSGNESEELESLDLSTPNNRNDALKSFLNRTK